MPPNAVQLRTCPGASAPPLGGYAQHERENLQRCSSAVHPERNGVKPVLNEVEGWKGALTSRHCYAA
jgi:hypothetical protein